MSDRILEIVVQVEAGGSPEGAACHWAEHLCLLDGTRIRVVGHHGHQARNPRHYVAWQGSVVSARQYRIRCAVEPLAAVLQDAARPLSASDVLDIAHAQGRTDLDIGLVGIDAAAQVLVREGRVRAGEIPRTWIGIAQRAHSPVDAVSAVRRAGG